MMIYAGAPVLVMASFLRQALVASIPGNRGLYLFLASPLFIVGLLEGIGTGLSATALSLCLRLYATGV
jgi:hypothetical protein